MGNMYQLKLKSTYGKVSPRTKVRSLRYINTYKRYQKYNKPY